jgi:signal transduction histidine kinase
MVDMRIKQVLNFITTSNTFIAFVVLMVGFAATLVSWQEARATVTAKTTDTLTQVIDSTDDAFQKRIAIYEEFLRGGVGLFTVRGEIISRTGFSRYAASLDLQQRFPGVQGVGFAQVVKHSELAAHQQSVRDSGFPAYTVTPEGSRDVYTPIVYIEPFNERNSRALGYDMFSDPTRRAAIESARDTGKPAITDSVTLIQETEETKQAGILYYLPIYSGSSDTIEERRAHIIGYIYAPIRIGDLVNGIFNQEELPDVSVKVFNTLTKSPDHLVYSNETPPGDIIVSKPLIVGDHTWSVQASGSAKILGLQERQQPFLIFILGTGGSLLLSAFIFIVMRSRSRELAYQKQLDVQHAKDELLSLASHQLRTPATGVKQYLGIVLEGYTGDITKEQRQMLQKANASNERQLEIVNQLLHVTRLETGRLVLRFANFNVTNLLEDIINEQKETIKSRGQTFSTTKPKEPVFIQGDEQYLRMAIENLVSNASKYTFTDGSISASLVEAPDRVTISVSDTGVGIDPDDQGKLFQKFSRIDNELSVQAGGSGIGLYLTKEVIELHGGTIRVDSEPNSGSTFTVTLPKQPNKTRKV